MTKWIVHYIDGTTFSSEDGDPEDAPRQGVALVAESDKDAGRILHWNQDTYCREGNRWVPHDRYSCERYLDTEKHPIRLVGYWVQNDVFWKLYKSALTDPRLPEKTCQISREQGGSHEWSRYNNERG